VKPVRNVDATTILKYNSTTGEILYTDPSITGFTSSHLILNGGAYPNTADGGEIQFTSKNVNGRKYNIDNTSDEMRIFSELMAGGGGDVLMTLNTNSITSNKNLLAPYFKSSLQNSYSFGISNGDNTAINADNWNIILGKMVEPSISHYKNTLIGRNHIINSANACTNNILIGDNHLSSVSNTIALGNNISPANSSSFYVSTVRNDNNWQSDSSEVPNLQRGYVLWNPNTKEFTYQTTMKTTGIMTGTLSLGNVLQNYVTLYATSLTQSYGLSYPETAPFQNSVRVYGSSIGESEFKSYYNPSDYRLKENVTEMKGALSIVEQLKPYTFTWKKDGVRQCGFIAHEIAESVPWKLVYGEKDAKEKETPVFQQVDYVQLVPLLTQCIKDQQQIINDLLRRVSALELGGAEKISTA
jgi:hypothetical protein